MAASLHRRAIGAGALAAALAGAPAVAAEGAQSYPSRPIRIVVPYTPGGPADTLARLFAQKFNETWGQPAIVDNRPGGNTFIGAEIVAKAQPDGYTHFIAFVGTLAINPGLYRKLPYDPIKDFEPISMLAMVPLILVVNPNVPAKNVKDLIAHAKANPGKLTYSSGGVGQGSHLAGEIFESMTGVDMVHVPYKGNAQAAAEVVGGHITMIFDGMSSSLPFVKSGKLRAIGITTAKRASAVPNLPTLAEQGLTGYDVGSWVGILATGGTPKPIVDKLYAEVNRLLGTAEMKAKIAAIGLEPLAMTPQEFSAYIKSETAKWVGALKAAGIKPE
ncbi:MAG: tripartite tricarboxylate transporter substrate binding protein [Burkholderiales bacterium]|nr:tripartite tricarboxylate transporter substrate binding protein [Burkholderiales bacterium]